MSGLKRILLAAGITLALAGGCGSSGSSGGEGGGTTISKPSISSFICPDVNENTTGTCAVTATDATSYTTKSGITVAYDTSGKGTFTAPSVNKDTKMSTEVCANNDAGSTCATTEVLVKDVGGPTMAESAQITLPACNNPFDHNPNATDPQGGLVNYKASSTSEIVKNLIADTTGVRGDVNCTDTRDGYTANVAIEACNQENGCSNQKLELIVNGLANKIPTTSIERQFNEDGTVTYLVTGKDSDGKVVEVYLNLNEGGYATVTPTEAKSEVKVIGTPTEILETNTLYAKSKDNEDGVSEEAVSEFTRATETEARAEIKKILEAKGLILNSTYFIDSSVSGVRTDYTILYDGKWATINFTSGDDNKSTDLANYETLKLGTYANDLQLTGFPLYEVIARTQAFANNGFMNVQ